jgi:hypothetical protein
MGSLEHPLLKQSRFYRKKRELVVGVYTYRRMAMGMEEICRVVLHLEMWRTIFLLCTGTTVQIESCE